MTPVDLAATATARPEADKPPYVDAAQTVGLLVERIGPQRAAQAWETLPRAGQIARADAAAAVRIFSSAAAA